MAESFFTRFKTKQMENKTVGVGIYRFQHIWSISEKKIVQEQWWTEIRSCHKQHIFLFSSSKKTIIARVVVCKNCSISIFSTKQSFVIGNWTSRVVRNFVFISASISLYSFSLKKCPVYLMALKIFIKIEIKFGFVVVHYRKSP